MTVNVCELDACVCEYQSVVFSSVRTARRSFAVAVEAYCCAMNMKQE